MFKFIILVFIVLTGILSEECKIVLRIFGDSHADNAQMEILKNLPADQKEYFSAYTYSQHGRLMYSVGRDGLRLRELFKVPRIARIHPWKKHERKNRLFNLTIDGVALPQHAQGVPEVNEKDIIYFIYGEIDARHKINEQMMGKHNRSNLFEEVNRIVDNYLRAVVRAIEEIPAKTVWIGGLHPQPKEVEGTNNWSLTTGSFERRWIITLLINRRLKKFCDENGYFFNDLTEGYATPEGDLDMTMTDGNHHVLIWTDETKNIIAKQLLAHRNKFCNISV